MAEIKFCGLTRPEDAALAASLGARYLGVIFAGGPRKQSPEAAGSVLEAANGTAARRVGVFGAQPVAEILTTAQIARLDVLQLHEGGSHDVVAQLRQEFAGEIWRVVRVAPELERGHVAETLRGEASGVDALVVDALVAGRLGGTGVAVDWSALAAAWPEVGRSVRLVLAGGLTPDNVAEAVRLARPAVVDVSSGVESAPGIKDADKLRAFARAVLGARN